MMGRSASSAVSSARRTSRRRPRDKVSGEGEQPDGPQPLSEKLVDELTARRTAALRNELALRPETALLAVIHALALAAFYNDREASCVEIVAKRTWLSSQAPGIDEASAETQIAIRQDMWAKRLPKDQGKLWVFLKE
jgi:ParB family chromosome partitioning protein